VDTPISGLCDSRFEAVRDEFAFGYAMKHVIPRWQSSRNRALIDALYGSL
jgi:hypothetical protein